MTRIGFQLDEHMPSAVARALRESGIDVETTGETGLLGASDNEQLKTAHAHGRVMVTEDEDYSELHGRGLPHSGIVYFPGGRRSIGDLVESIRLVYESFTAEEMVGRLEYL